MKAGTSVAVASGPEVGRIADVSEADADQARRSFTPWDGVSILLLISVMLGINHLAVAWADTPLGRSPVVRAVSVGLAGLALLLFAGLMIRDRLPPAEVSRRLIAVWRDPPRDAVAFVLGLAMSLPLLGFYWPRLIVDADSARVLASVTHVMRGDLGHLADVQEPYLPHVLLAPVISAHGLVGVKIFTLVSVQVLAGVTALVTYRLTRRMWGAAAAVLGLLCIPEVVKRVFIVPLYPVMLTLGYLGAWYAYRAVSDPERRWRYAVPAGLCLALAPEAQALGQIFLAVPLLVAVFAPTVRAAAAQVARLYAVIALATLPRLAINLSEGGLGHVTSYRTDWWVTRGYVREIQENLLDYAGINEPLAGYLSRLPGRFLTSLGGARWLLVILAIIAWLLCCRARARWFVAGAVGLMVLAVTVEQVPPFPRYYSPLLPGMAILVGVLVAALARQQRLVAKAGAIASSVALISVAAGNYDAAVERFAEPPHFMDWTFQGMVDSIDDDRGVIGARAHQILFTASTDVPAWGDQFLTEEEYATFLTWPSDGAVVRMMKRHDIGWVLLHPLRDLEIRYNNTWLIPHYHLVARHVGAVITSPNFCLWYEVAAYTLYKLGPCPPDREPPASEATRPQEDQAIRRDATTT
jgi:hypothetical protein